MSDAWIRANASPSDPKGLQADFRQHDLRGARFAKAVLADARCDRIQNPPAEIQALIEERRTVQPATTK
jgi:hypothetical protein